MAKDLIKIVVEVPVGVRTNEEIALALSKGEAKIVGLDYVIYSHKQWHKEPPTS